MQILLTVIAVIVIFSVLVLIHEYGHFIAARRAGIKVLEFGIGFPPRLFKKKVGETLYTVNAIPFGGFVKLLGEDASDPKALKNKQSFAGKSPWVRTKVVAAGVFMNFLLAIVLLTIGFSFGIEPLLVTEADLYTHLASGTVKTAPGIFVSKVSGEAAQLPLAPGDQILAVDDRPITDVSQVALFEKGKAEKDVDLTVLRKADGAVSKLHVPLVGKNTYLGIDLKPFTQFPRLRILEVKPGSNMAKAGLLRGDVILRVNDTDVYNATEFDTILSQAVSVTVTVLRGEKQLTFTTALPEGKRVVIADVFPATEAAKQGFQKGDIILAVSGAEIASTAQVPEIIQANLGKELEYTVLRDGRTTKIRATVPEKSRLGIAVSISTSFRNNELSFYHDSLLTSIVEIGKVRYAPWTALKQSLAETVRLTGITVGAFVKTIGSLVSRMGVPAEIGGPVQIAYYTHTFVQEGIFALLRFTALLSLSLAVINVLPIPALDGGRLLFIVLEVVLRKKVNARFEAMVHSIGFVLLLLLIGLVTYSDIVKLF